MHERPWKDEFTLLCEKCGYVIEGLDTSGACPECGKAIAESLPERRVGTAWQRTPSWRTLVRTGLGTLAHPFRTASNIRCDGRSGVLLSQRHSLLAGTLLVTPILAAAFFIGFEGWSAESVALGVVSPFIALLFIGLATATCDVLTNIEARGLQFFGSKRLARVDEEIAWTVCGHGSFGWVVAGMGGGLAFSSAILAIGPFTNQAAGSVLAWIGIGSIVAGFLFFEVFAWLGLRRCRFANRVRPGEPGAPERP